MDIRTKYQYVNLLKEDSHAQYQYFNFNMSVIFLKCSFPKEYFKIIGSNICPKIHEENTT